MKEFNLSKWRQFIIEEAVVADGNFGNDIEDRYAYIRPLMADLPDTARTETLIDGMEDGLREDDKELFDFYFVEAMKALGLEHQLMDDGGIEGPGIEDLTPDSALGPNPSFVEEAEGEETDYMKRRRKMSDYYVDNEAEEIDAEDLDASADYFDSLAENDEVLDEILNEVDFKEGDKVTMKQGGEEMEVVGIRKMFGNNTKAYKVKKANGEEVEYSANQLKKVMSPEEKANVFVR